MTIQQSLHRQRGVGSMTGQLCPDCEEPGEKRNVGTGWHTCETDDCPRKAYPTRRPTP